VGFQHPLEQCVVETMHRMGLQSRELALSEVAFEVESVPEELGPDLVQVGMPAAASDQGWVERQEGAAVAGSAQA